ncbi:MAG TPA: dihydropteroate synthase [Vicinamibacterales bacterium]|nr:dihydropteroate synthase [Vicinamibacterales bacterium]
MGILNVTPDSFAEREPLTDVARAVDAAIEMEAHGADIVDVGGESTRPGAATVTAGEEASRVIPVIRALAGRLRVPISVDTRKSSVARQALAEGASIVNDVSGFREESGMAGVVADAGAAAVLMHLRGHPEDMYRYAHYENLAAEIAGELRQSVQIAVDAGVPRNRIIADPGIGFAKHAAHSYGVFARIHELSSALDLPVLIGPSRKSFMREALNNRPAIERDWGTAAAVTAAVLGGAHIVRVHAVAEMSQVVRVAEEIRTAWTD